MATGIKTSKRKRRSAADAAASRADKVQRFVNGRLSKTGNQVRTIDLVGTVLGFIAGLLAFLMVVAIIDAWVWPLSGSARWIAFAMLVIGTAAVIGLCVVRFVRRKINPDYVAQMIEQSEPSLKNSLLNYVTLRRKPDGINPAVFDAVSRRAATDISAVPVDSAVDRTNVIRIGFILVAITMLVVGYKMLSPKDPFDSFARILFPSARVSAPSVVRIIDVTPGDTNVFFADSVEVAATVEGRHEPGDVRLVFSTDDGSITDAVVPMELEIGTTNRYIANIPGDGAGLQQSAHYQISARDGQTPSFAISVSASPAITVDRVELQPPAYSGIEPWTQPARGDIEALEGTRAGIYAKANLPIESATIELLRKADGRQPTADEFVVVETIAMNGDAPTETYGSILVAFSNDRQQARATHYRVRFTSENGYRNQRPNVYSIQVIPDLAPEIQIVEPVQRQVSVAANGSLLVQMWAQDIDFEISEVVFDLEQNGRRRVHQSLPLEPVNGKQRVNARYIFSPEQYQMQPGDQAMFYAVAHDNRASAVSGEPDPNIARSENFTIEITEPTSEAAEEKQEQQQREQERQEQRRQQEENNPDQESQDDGDSQDEPGSESPEQHSDEQNPMNRIPMNKNRAKTKTRKKVRPVANSNPSPKLAKTPSSRTTRGAQTVRHRPTKVVLSLTPTTNKVLSRTPVMSRQLKTPMRLLMMEPVAKGPMASSKVTRQPAIVPMLRERRQTNKIPVHRHRTLAINRGRAINRPIRTPNRNLAEIVTRPMAAIHRERRATAAELAMRT